MLYFTGELNETQKRKLEKKESFLKEKEKELLSVKSQMGKLTLMVDQYKDDIRKLKLEVK